jgi:hypothetical protein
VLTAHSAHNADTISTSPSSCSPVEPTAPIAIASAGTIRPPSRQVSGNFSPVVEHKDHMSAVVQNEDPQADDDLDPDVSLFVPKRAPAKKATGKATGKATSKAGAKRPRPSSTTSANNSDGDYVDLEEIPYMMKIYNAMFVDNCSPTDWEATTTKWGLKSGSIDVTQAAHALAQVNAPIWSIKPADKPASTPPIMILSADAWKKLVEEINEREKAIQKAERERRKKPKSMIPLLVVKVEQEVSLYPSLNHKAY